MNRLVAWLHVRPVLDVMAVVDNGKTAWCMCPYSVPPATSRKSNSTCFPSADGLATMRGRFPAFAIVSEEKAVIVEIHHGDRIIRPDGRLHIVHHGVTHGSHAKSDLPKGAIHFGMRRVGCETAFPGAGEGFDFLERLLSFGFWVSVICASCCAKAATERDSNTTGNKQRSDLIFVPGFIFVLLNKVVDSSAKQSCGLQRSATH